MSVRFSEPVATLAIPAGRVDVDTATAALVSIVNGGDDTDFVAAPGGAGLVRLAVPLEGYAGHFVETGTHGRAEVERHGDEVRLTFHRFHTSHGEFAVRIEVTIRATPDGLVLRARVRNDSEHAIAQVAFPQLLGLRSEGYDPRAPVEVHATPAAHPSAMTVRNPAETRVKMSRGTLWPRRELAMRADDASFLDTPLQRYYGYGAFEFSMKWLDYGNAHHGLTLYARDRRYRTQGLLVERPARGRDEVDLRWLHLPTIAAGERWDSGDFVLTVHDGDWYAGARAFQRFAAPAYPYAAPAHLREALGIRTVWPAIRNTPPNFVLDDLPDYAAEIADPELGLVELCVWHWWHRNGLPIIVDERIGGEPALRRALARCRELGVPVSLFVSNHLLRDTDESPDEWKHRNAAGQTVGDDWTYGRDFLPRFRVPFVGTHAMVRGSLLAPGMRAAIRAEYERLLELGATSISWDQFWAWFEPNYAPGVDGAPDEEGDRMLELGRQLRDLIRDHDPRGTFSGEMMTEQKVPILDYTWEWRNSTGLDQDAPFRYVFPQVRLNVNVNEHPRGALLAFLGGGLINVMPGQMHSFRLADCPELVATLRRLAALRRRYLRYFVEGQYRHDEGVTVDAATARAYSCGDDVLVVVANPTDDPVPARVRIDPTVWGGRPLPAAPTIVDLDGVAVDGWSGGELRATLEPDALRILEFARSVG